ncbi:hypothetical protein NBRC110019_20190 [Neptunitalea chrysea]|uniref:YdhG-like domain-containing protein n=1 Tax=Neptunitalea chrysea TaxID=1647581 RepID=A0A9W6B801_9FLAO|nr:DUF1801 domain-containing protein [Neptunitalea chrysea]GLB52979.1 hypothetical protein NBRC110019_20190 [Neptunitalea chrysea]
MNPLEQFYAKQPEPHRSVFLVLRSYFLAKPNMTEAYKYGAPFFYCNGKRCFYFWNEKKTNQLYIGVIDGMQLDHPALEQGDRKRMKIFRINPFKDIDMELLDEVVTLVLQLYV